MKKGVFIILSSILLLSVLPSVSAEILIGQTDVLYNWGDDFNLDITLSPANNAKGFFTADLACSSSIVTAGDIDVDALLEELENSETEENVTEENTTEEEETILETITSGEIEIYKSPENILGGEQKIISISTSLDSFFIGDLKGDCLIRASYAGEVAESQIFKISQDIDVDLEVEGFAFDPGNIFTISGSAIKGNGKPLEGFVTISLPGLGINISGTVIAGQFGSNISIPSNSASGEYNILVNAYEKDELGEIINQGSAGESIRIEQIITDLGIALNSQTVVPGTELIYTILLFDQAGNEIIEDVKVIIYDSEENVFSEGLVDSGSANSILIESNYLPGYWKIESSIENLNDRKAVYIEELETVSFVMLNDTLTITNTGNVPYDKPIEITIGNETKVENVYLDIGESVIFELTAPDGEYEISVSDGEASQTLGIAALTGRAISIREPSQAGIFSGSLLWIWIILILIAAGVVVYLLRKRKKKSFLGTTPKIMGEAIKESEAQAGISSGQKEETSIVALKIKSPLDSQKGSGSQTESINKALMKAKELKAKIYIDGDYRVIVLSQILTKQKENNVTAIKIAQQLEKDLNEHNTKYNKKIAFGIGVNVGDMIVESNEGKFRFTSLRNTIGLAKRIAGSANSEVLMSDAIHKKSIGKIKSEKSREGDYWKIRRIVDRGRHSGFIENFKRRQKEDERKKRLKEAAKKK